jgi:hypothetical protein
LTASRLAVSRIAVHLKWTEDSKESPRPSPHRPRTLSCALGRTHTFCTIWLHHMIVIDWLDTYIRDLVLLNSNDQKGTRAEILKFWPCPVCWNRNWPGSSIITCHAYTTRDKNEVNDGANRYVKARASAHTHTHTAHTHITNYIDWSVCLLAHKHVLVLSPSTALALYCPSIAAHTSWCSIIPVTVLRPWKKR